MDKQRKPAVRRQSSKSDTEDLQILAPNPILLVDNSHPEAGVTDNLKNGIWANSVRIPEYDIVEGSTRAGGYVVYLIHIETATGGEISISKRYSEFADFHDALVVQFPKRKREIPDIPPKSIVSKFRPTFLESRRIRLEYFLLCVLLNPALASSDLVKQFVR
jgi:hypothetical protein